MRTNNPFITKLVKEKMPINIENKWFVVISNPLGSCNDCYFSDKERCPQKAVTICCSNGGNILKLSKRHGR